MSYTPGPWYDDSSLPPNDRPVICRTAHGLPISASWHGPIPQGQDDANASLITAAPDLLGAAKLALDVLAITYEDGQGIVNAEDALHAFGKLRAAIDKTEGR